MNFEEEFLKWKIYENVLEIPSRWEQASKRERIFFLLFFNCQCGLWDFMRCRRFGVSPPDVNRKKNSISTSKFIRLLSHLIFEIAMGPPVCNRYTIYNACSVPFSSFLAKKKVFPLIQFFIQPSRRKYESSFPNHHQKTIFKWIPAAIIIASWQNIHTHTTHLMSIWWWFNFFLRRVIHF